MALYPTCEPSKEASAGGSRFSSFHKTGDGPWTGTVTDADGVEYPVLQMIDGWKHPNENGNVTARTLVALVTKLVTK